MNNERQWQRKQWGNGFLVGSLLFDKDYDDNHKTQYAQKALNSGVSDYDYADKPNQQRQRQWHHPQLHNQRLSNVNDDEDFSGNWTDVQPFHTKISHRLQESQQLSDQPDIKRKIQKLADDKFNACKFNGAENKGKADRHCVGRATGQIMQLIAAFENGSRNLPGLYDF